jgi:hypothetical protein
MYDPDLEHARNRPMLRGRKKCPGGVGHTGGTQHGFPDGAPAKRDDGGILSLRYRRAIARDCLQIAAAFDGRLGWSTI